MELVWHSLTILILRNILWGLWINILQPAAITQAAETIFFGSFVVVQLILGRESRKKTIIPFSWWPNVPQTTKKNYIWFIHAQLFVYFFTKKKYMCVWIGANEKQ